MEFGNIRMYLKTNLLLFLLVCVFSAKAEEATKSDVIRAMVINTEWLWTPFDGRVDGQKVNKGDMRPREYKKEIAFYADLISRNAIDVVALIEIENKSVAEDLAAATGASWNVAFRQGRDTATGQDVALISRLKQIEGSTTDFSFPEGKIGNEKKGKRPSKLVGSSYWFGDKRLGVVTSHFLSKRNDSLRKSKNRLRQADALAQASRKQKKAVDYQIVLGDFNDNQSSKVIETLRLRGNLNIVENGRGVLHILHKGLSLREASHEPAYDFSDHAIFWAELAVR